MTTETKYFEHTLTTSPHSHPPSTAIPLRLAYQTHGNPPHASHQPRCVLLPTCYGGKLATTFPNLISGSNTLFPPSSYFVITVGLLGGSESSSPSNAQPPYDGAKFPKLTSQTQPVNNASSP